MDFDFLAKNFEVIQKGKDLKVSHIATHSKDVKAGGLFVAIKGHQLDGHDFINEAIQAGAQFILLENTSFAPQFQGTVLKTKNTKEALSIILNEYYNFPSDKLFTVGITGTNGKTTTAYLIEHIFNACGWESGVIGTIDHHIGSKTWASFLTTSEPTEIFKRLNDFLKYNAKSAIMEVSSIGLDQHRVHGVGFNISIFTNLTWDHMDYHTDMENYFKVKAELFLNPVFCKKGNHSLALINKDDVYGARLLSQLKYPSKTYGTYPADFSFKIKKRDLFHTYFYLETPFGSGDVKLPLTGDYNVYNAVAAISCALNTGFSFKKVIESVETFRGVPGRVEKCAPNKSPFQVFVDYAHTPSALKEVLNNLKQAKLQRLITVFGCGGDRDKDKRKKMTLTAKELSDQIILTSDNPRSEDPEKIIEDCLNGIEDRSKFTIQIDRREAIHEALNQGVKGDIVLIAGKGHESYQLIQGKKYPFKDQDVVKEWFESKKNTL